MGKLIAVTGMGGSGKSTVLINLASAFADAGLSTGCFSCDLRAPSLPIFLNMEIPRTKSLGKLFAQSAPASQFMEYARVKGLFVSATARGESSLDYEPPERTMIEAFLQKLKAAFDVVLVECPDIQFNSFSALSIRACDMRINILSPTPQGIAWEQACAKMLSELRPVITPIYVVNGSDASMKEAELSRLFGVPVPVFFSYCDGIRQSTLLGEPYYLMGSGRSAKVFRQGINKLKELVWEGGIT